MLTRASFTLLLLTGLAAPALAADLVGRAVDRETGDPVELVTVSLIGEDGKTLANAMTDEKGGFRFRGVRDETVGLVLSRVGYRSERVDAVRLNENAATEVTVELDIVATMEAPIVVTASRTPETSFGAPASVSVVDAQDIEMRQTFTPTDVLRGVEGVQYTQKGITSAAWVIRGSGGRVLVGPPASHVLQDWRNTRLAGFGIKLPYFLSATTPDIERIEVVRAPTGAMYGPDAGTAVIHVLTKSAFDYQGTSLSMGGGNQSLVEGWGRHSGLLSSKLGYKLSLRYLQAEDWTPDANTLGADKANRDLEQLNGNASVEWRPDGETQLHLAAGKASALKLLEQIPELYVQFEDFSQSFAQARLHRRRMMANFYYTVNHTGGGTMIPIGAPLKENSQSYAAQLHNGSDLRTGSLLNRFTYGVDLRTIDLRTDSTLSRRWEDNDTVTEVGAFLQTKTLVSSKLDLFGAIRADYHDRVDDGIVFPYRIGASYRTSPSHSFRLMLNQLTAVAAPGGLFGDSPAGFVRGYAINSVSPPKGGWNFRRDCEDGLCMRSRYVEEGMGDYGAADATRTWGALQELYPELAGIPAPSSSDVGTILATFNRANREFEGTDPASVRDVSQVDRNGSTQLDIGYTGWVNDRLSIDATAWMQDEEIESTSNQIITPNVFFDEGSLEDYLIGQNLSPEEADSLASEIADLPVGTVTPVESGASDGLISTDVSTTVGKQVTRFGVDVGTSYRWPSGWQLRLSYSWRAPRWFVEGQSLPRHPHSVGLARVAYDPAGPGLRGSVEVRGQTSKYMDVGLWKGEVAGFVVADVNLGYRPASLPQMGFYLNVSNVLGHEHVQVVGGKVLGRLITGRVQVDL